MNHVFLAIFLLKRSNRLCNHHGKSLEAKNGFVVGRIKITSRNFETFSESAEIAETLATVHTSKIDRQIRHSAVTARIFQPNVFASRISFLAWRLFFSGKPFLFCFSCRGGFFKDSFSLHSDGLRRHENRFPEPSRLKWDNLGKKKTTSVSHWASETDRETEKLLQVELTWRSWPVAVWRLQSCHFFLTLCSTFADAVLVKKFILNFFNWKVIWTNFQSWVRYQKFCPVAGSRYFFPPTSGSKYLVEFSKGR